MFPLYIKQKQIVNADIIHNGIAPITVPGSSFVCRKYFPLIAIPAEGQNFLFWNLLKNIVAAADDSILIQQFVLWQEKFQFSFMQKSNIISNFFQIGTDVRGEEYGM